MIPNWKCGDSDLRESWGDTNVVASRENLEDLLVQEKDGRDSHIQWAADIPPAPDPCSQVWKSVWGCTYSQQEYTDMDSLESRAFTSTPSTHMALT